MMTSWTRRFTIIAGVGLILLTNLVALLGVAFNHSGVPDSTLQLSQRELEIPYHWRKNSDNSGIALRLLWRFPGSRNEYYQYGDNDPGWLDQGKLASLGFDVAMPINTDRGQAMYRKQRSKPVFLVMELDGLAYQQSIELAKKEDEADPKKKDGNERARPSALSQELNLNSRLFVVDAGLDREALRAKYPDTRHYSIVHGKIRPNIIYSKEKQPLMSGYINVVGAQSINVPLEFRSIFEPMQKRNQKFDYGAVDKRTAFEATVAFGRRLEPWIAAASVK
jgi:hypothetical protein